MAEFANSNDNIVDVLVIGSGLSGLQCARHLTDKSNLNVKVVEAQNYIGGRILQNTSFVKGVTIDIGAEIMHGSKTVLNQFAKEHNEPTVEIFCWAHGDGGPLDHDVNGGYGLYFLQDGEKARLIRYDDEDEDFVKTNETLWDIAELDENDFPDSLNLQDYLISQGITKPCMLDMANAGYSNTLCTTSQDLSLKQAIRWNRGWNEESGDDGEFKFINSYGCLLNYLKEGLDIQLNTPIQLVRQCEQDGLVEVHAKDGQVFRAKTVVAGVTPYVFTHSLLEFDPPLEESRMDAMHCMKMHPAMKVIVKFRQRFFPRKLQGMIMAGEGCMIPECWFTDVSSKIPSDGSEEATCYATGFVTSEFANTLLQNSDEEIAQIFVNQLSRVLSNLEPRVMSAHPEEDPDLENPEDLPDPKEVYICGMVYKWRDQEHPYIGGGYSSALAGKSVYYADIISKPWKSNVFFCGEYTGLQSGAVAHTALETGVRAAEEAAAFLNVSLHN